MAAPPKVIDLSPLHNLGPGGLENTELVNGKHIILSCSKCRKKLADAWLTQPNLDVHTKIVAECDYCGARSFEQDINGKFHLGGTDESGLIDVKHDFIDGPGDSTGIYQKMTVQTKRLK